MSSQSPLQLLSAPAPLSVVPLNGRVEFVFNHEVTLGSALEATLERENVTMTLRLDNQRFLTLQGNHVFCFFDPSLMTAGQYILVLPEGAFQSTTGLQSELIEVELNVVDKQCNTNYVVGGMYGETCKCYSVSDRCQCVCGETFFSRAF